MFIGDVVGSTGRTVVERLLPELREREGLDFVVVNGENSAGGLGITPKIAHALLDAGADAITLGNHAFHHRDVFELLDRDERIVRPANYPKAAPGRGHTVVARDGMELAVVNLSGQVGLDAARSPFAEVDAILGELRGSARHILVDLHAEATSEKIAMGWHLDGRVTACVGTHTHVPTADARVLPGGTAYVTDVGMTGARGGVIGFRREPALKRFLTQVPARFEPADEDPWLNAVIVEADESGSATGIRQLLLPYSPSSAASNGGVNQTM
jgi:metallophosphoesterase (TIGR00282 family)